MAFTREVPVGSGRIMRYSQGARRATQFSPGYSMVRWVLEAFALWTRSDMMQHVDPKILGVSTEHSNSPGKDQSGIEYFE